MPRTADTIEALRARLADVERRAIMATPCTKRWRDLTREASDLRAAIRAASEPA